MTYTLYFVSPEEGSTYAVHAVEYESIASDEEIPETCRLVSTGLTKDVADRLAGRLQVRSYATPK